MEEWMINLYWEDDIKRNKIKEDKKKEEEWYQGRMFGEMKM